MKRKCILTTTNGGAAMWVVLVVLIVTLFIMLIPPGCGGREKARRTQCLSNLKQFGLAFAMYAEESQGRMPMDSDNPTLAGSLRLVEKWVSGTKIMVCPSANTDRWLWDNVYPAKDWSRLTSKNIGYSYVPNLLSTKDTNIVVMLDKVGSTKKGSKWPADGNHHDARGNVLFTDGHVWFFASLPSDLKDKDGVERVLSP